MHILFFLFLFFLFSGCSGGNLGPPHPSDTNLSPSESPFVFYLEKKIHPTGKFQVLDPGGEKLVYETSLPIQWIPRDSDLPDLGKELQIFPKEGFKLSNLKPGDYLFRILIFHKSENQEELPIASIDTNASVKKNQETPLDFSKSSWNYPDDDGDGFSNIAELADGFYDEERPRSPSELLPWASWNSTPTDPKNPNSHPTGPSLITPEKIHPTSPDDTRNSKLIGEILSVQAGTQFTAIHFASNGAIKEKINFSSKIDGSFEVPLKNSEEDDQIAIVLTSKMQGDQIPDLSTSESESFGKLMKITYRPLKVIHCWSLPGVDPVAGSGYVLLEGEGISANANENVVCFPSSGSEIPSACGGAGSGKGGFVQSNEVSIASQASRTVTLKAKIPEGSISGFPRVHTATTRIESYGECPKNQVVSILQNGKNEPDLYIPEIFAPHAALFGTTVSIDIPIANQGLREINSGTPLPYLTYISPNPVGTANDDEILDGIDREIFPDSPNLTQPREGIGVSEKIHSGINKGSFRYPQFSQNQYFLSPVPLSIDKFSSALFKAKVNPPDQNRNRSATEQNFNNNSHAASHNTFIYHLNLHFSLIPPSKTIDIKTSTLHLTPSFWEDPQSGYIIPVMDDSNNPLPLNRNEALEVSLGALINKGTFPLERNKTDPSKYTPGLNDPLSTEGAVYKNNFKLYQKRDSAEGVIDLKKVAATELIEQANLLNQKTELPILIRVYYSKYNTFDRKIAVPLLCENENGEKKCEFCYDRLEQGGSIDIKTLTLGPLNDETKFNPGAGWLFIVAEAIQIDPKKVKRNEGVQYCAVSDQIRKEMHLGKGDRGVPISDYKPSDNIIRIKIDLQKN